MHESVRLVRSLFLPEGRRTMPDRRVLRAYFARKRHGANVL
ncbi:hypothetical protein SELSPUOL_02236 [Selenomonas sputigena ATCC 35185]|uniref:Uncharacterized protein n=1 Tax=Selenomonas sputigena (strain ATCC 35185 / DSM 20758 / CCUG 44933 / VPI D19B-28) TaxID=546271 RepID=C9LXM8_SELS3|nr:hypothetical protein SELSPUOL_02236 [Selenomonas sputigena ATCC 35185]